MEIENKLLDALVYGKTKQLEKIFEEIYSHYYKFVYFCIKQYVNQKEDIEELADDTFVSFYNSLNRNSIIESLKAYLWKCATNKAIQHLKSKKIEIVEINENMAKDEISITSNNDLFSFYKSKLEKEEFYILIHHVIYDETFNEIALDINKSINTVKSTYRRLIKKLKGEKYENK